MTKDQLVRELVKLAADIRDDSTMSHGDVDHVARCLAEQRTVLRCAIERREREGPPPMRPLGTKPHRIPDGKIGRNMSTPESRAFWDGCDEAAREVATWPAWKRACL